MNDFIIEEYRQLRAEMAEREKFICQYFLFAVGATGSILAVLGGWLFRDGGTLTPIVTSWIISVFFLTPLIVTFPIAFLLVALRREIHFTGKYIQVFYDEAELGAQWELRIERFRSKWGRRHTLDVIPTTFWLLHIACFICFYVGIILFHGPVIETLPIPLGAFILTLRFNVSFLAITTTEKAQYLDCWRYVYDEEIKQKSRKI